MQLQVAAARSRRVALILTAFVGALEAAADWTVTRCGRCYIAAAAVLISCVTFVFFAAVIPEVPPTLDHPPWTTRLAGPLSVQYGPDRRGGVSSCSPVPATGQRAGSADELGVPLAGALFPIAGAR